MKTIQANAIVSSFAGMCTIMIVFIGFLGIVSSKVFAQSKEDNNFSGTPFVQLSEEDGLEPFDSKKIAGLILAGVIGEKDFFNLYTEQGVSEEQLVAVLKQVYAQQGFRVDEGEVEGIVHVKLFSGLGIEKEKKPNTLTRAMQTSACENYDVSNWKEPKKNVKRGPDFPYHVVRLANTQVCGPDNDYVLDY